MQEAVTHCSWPEANSSCYQRLEFLGDAVLDLLVTRHIFKTYPCALGLHWQWTADLMRDLK